MPASDDERREKILILGGTREAAQLAAELVRSGKQVISSLAGRTNTPEEIAGEVRIGGFGGASGLAQWMKEHRISHLIDATHPFARQISKNAVDASRLANVQLDIRTREPWQKQPGDRWIEVASVEEAASKTPKGARVLLALGSQYLTAFHHRDDVHFLVRMVDQPSTPLPFKKSGLILGKPSDQWREEAELMQQNNITHMVCRNSGGTGAYAKIEAARRLAIPVIMVTLDL